MRRFSTLLFPLFLLAVGLLLTGAVGCRREESREPSGEGEAIAKPQDEKEDESKPHTGREVLNRLIIAYRKASRYADAGTVRLVVE